MYRGEILSIPSFIAESDNPEKWGLSKESVDNYKKKLLANTYHDVITFDLKGNVKECTFGDKTYKFGRNGKYRPDNIKMLVKYDENNRISLFGEANPTVLGAWYESFEYDDYHGRVILHTTHVFMLGIDVEKQILFMYDNKGFIFKESDNYGSESKYSDYKLDSYGNWISRTKKDIKTGEITTETRTIKYY